MSIYLIKPGFVSFTITCDILQDYSSSQKSTFFSSPILDGLKNNFFLSRDPSYLTRELSQFSYVFDVTSVVRL